MSTSRLYFGGSFNPLHVGHLICARAVAEQRGFGKVVLIPTAQPPHKTGDTSIIAAEHRLAMCRLVAEEDPFFEAEDIEIQKGGMSYTIETVRELARRTGQKAHWLIGADMAAILPQWRESQALIREVEFVLMARPGWTFDWQSLPEAYRALRHNVVSAPLIQISATEIRQRLARGLPINYLVPPTIERYIHHHSLYQSPSREH